MEDMILSYAENAPFRDVTFSVLGNTPEYEREISGFLREIRTGYKKSGACIQISEALGGFTIPADNPGL
jgi:hypothetical protein